MRLAAQNFTFIALLLAVACGTNSGIQKPDECDVPGLEWMEATDKYDRTLVANLAAKFEAAAKADANKIKYIQDASASGNLGGDLKSTSEAHRNRVARVSQEFYQNAIAYRTSVCSLTQLLRDGHLIDASADRARDSLVEMSVAFGRIKAVEQQAVVNPTDPYRIYFACKRGESIAIETYTFPYSDIQKRDTFQEFSALLKELPNASCNQEEVAIFRITDEAVLSAESATSATRGGNTGAIVVPTKVLAGFLDKHLAFTFIKSFIDQQRR